MSRLGYPRFGAQGGDWGSSITTSLAQRHPGRLFGIHLTPPLAAPDPATFDELTEPERAALAALDHAAEWEDGYSAQQSTKPQTIGYSLVDSPAGLAAWMVEKFCSWSDSAGVPERALSRDRMLDDITLYWLTRTGASAARLYWESIRQVQQIFTAGVGDTVDVPAGGSIFAHENPRPSRRWAARRFTDLRYWNELDRGGHFAAWEQPELFVDEVRSFFRLVRSRSGHRVLDQGRVRLDLARTVAGPRPEEAAQLVTLGPGHDVQVQVRHRLADHVVDGHEGALRAECAAHRLGDPLGGAEQRHHQLARQIEHGVHVPHGGDQHMPLEDRPVIQKRHHLVVLHDDGRGQFSADDLADDIAHPRMLAGGAGRGGGQAILSNTCSN